MAKAPSHALNAKAADASNVIIAAGVEKIHNSQDKFAPPATAPAWHLAGSAKVMAISPVLRVTAVAAHHASPVRVPEELPMKSP